MKGVATSTEAFSLLKLFSFDTCTLVQGMRTSRLTFLFYTAVHIVPSRVIVKTTNVRTFTPPSSRVVQW